MYTAPQSKIMRNFLLFAVILCCSFALAQSAPVKDRYQAMQGQDLTVPPPPHIMFPAQYPSGNASFVKEIKEKLGTTVLPVSEKKRSTKIILKIDAKGTVLNISTYGKDTVFNAQVKEAATAVNAKKQWTAGKNAQGIKVIDIVNIPFRY